MKAVLDKLIADAPEENKGAAEVQLQIGGGAYAGALKQSDDFDGLYELMTVGQRPGKLGAQAFMVRIVFKADAVDAAFIPHDGDMGELSTQSGLVVPGVIQ